MRTHPSHSIQMSNSIQHYNNSNHPNSNNIRDKLSQSNLKKIQQHVSTFYSSPQCNSYCQCHLCKQNYEVLDKGKEFLRQTSSMIKIQTGRIKQFFRLLSGSNNKPGFRLQIPTMTFFQKGECKLMFKSRNQCISLQENHQVSKKNIANCFVQASRKKAQSRPLNNSNGLNHIRHFSAIVPSYIHGNDPILLNNENNNTSKLHTTTILNSAKNFYFHKDHRLQTQQQTIVERSAHEEVAIVKYLENKGLQLVNEKQLRQLLKSPVNTQCIDFIQGYIKPHERQSEFMFSQYSRFKQPENTLMWNRAETHVKLVLNIINSYAKDYIPIETLQSYQQVLKEIPQQYILYQNYKIIHFLSIARNLEINALTTLWMKDQFKEICFFSLINFQYEQKILHDVDLSENHAIKNIMEKPFNQLQEQLWQMWGKIKGQKLEMININNSGKGDKMNGKY